MNNLNIIYIWLWDASLCSHLNLGVSDILEIHISDSVMRPWCEMAGEEWGVIQHFSPLASAMSFGSRLNDGVGKLPSYSWLVLDPGEPSPTFRVSTSAVCLSGAHRLYHGGGVVIRRPTWRQIIRAHVIIRERKIP